MKRTTVASIAIAMLVLAACGDLGQSPVRSPADSAGPESEPTAAPAPVDPPPPGPRIPALIDFVQDGDSAIAIVDGEEQRIRLIGINAPERGECFGDGARTLLKDLIEGKTVDLVTDADPTDRFGRILAYVYDGDLLVNAEMVRRGAAIARPFEPNTTLQEVLEEAELAAQEAEVGMWAPAACGGSTDPDVAIIAIDANPPGPDDENRNGEIVHIENMTDHPIDLSGWGLKDESSVHRYVFPNGTVLDPGGVLRVHSGCGDDGPSDLYWCAETPVWGNAGDTGFLTAPDGAVHHRYSY